MGDARMRVKNDRLWYVWMTEATSATAATVVMAIYHVMEVVAAGDRGALWSSEQINTSTRPHERETRNAND